MTLLQLILSIIAATILSALWDSWYIKKHGNLKGARKILHLAPIYFVISALLIYRSLAAHDNWPMFLAYLPFAAFLYSFVKDPATALMLGKSPFYLGNGWFDSWQKTWPTMALWAFKIIGMIVFLNFFRLFHKNKPSKTINDEKN